MKNIINLLLVFFGFVGLIGSIGYMIYFKQYPFVIFDLVLGYLAYPEWKRRLLELMGIE